MNRIFHVCMKRKENLVYILQKIVKRFPENHLTISCNVNHYHVKREANVVKEIHVFVLSKQAIR